ncbi:MAG TPA: OmpA family protein [Burkholderiaceae bacterium]|nr:OmpA family protein [Burkholderiaceae bacterium]
MKKLNQVAMMVASIAVAGSAFATGTAVNSDNWRNGSGNLQWKLGNASGLCWRNANWTPATAAPGCDGAIAPAAAAPAAAAAPVMAAKPAAAAPAAAKPAAPAAAAAATKVTYAADTFFAANQAVLKAAGKAKLDDLIGKVKGINLEVIVAVGHTDSKGSDKANQALSVRRAEAVKAYLVSKGIEKNRVYTEGKGSKQPVADNKTAEGRAKNNRVEIEVVGTQKK